MSVRFEHPELLVVLVAVGLAAVVTHLRLAPAGSRHRRLWAGLHWGAVAVVAVALAQPQLRSSVRPSTVLVVDRSASVDANMQTTEDRWVAAVTHSSCPQPCRVIRLDADAVAVPATAGALASADATAVGSNIEAAVRTALGLVASHGRVVVLSDGWDSGTNPGAVAAAARARDVQIDSVRLSDSLLRYAAVTQVQAPATVHVGDAVPLRVTVRSSVTEPATLYLLRDGVGISSQTINLRPGENPLLLSYTAATPGWHSYQARVVLYSNDLPQNNELGATVDVAGAPRVLAVSGTGSGSVDPLLRRLGFSVTSVAPGALPSDPAAFAGEDAVVLDDVPATALSRSQMTALSSAVRQTGLGLVALGGPHSFSLGRYANTPLDALLPVSSLVPGNLQRRNVAIELVLDHSGSMIDLAGGVPKIQMVHVAGAQVARFVAARKDELGIIDFDILPHVLVAMQPLTTPVAQRTVTNRVEGLQASGGTNIYSALQAGLTQLAHASAPDKHLILMTDGISQPENYTPLLAAFNRDHIAVATLALGADADKSLLYDIAKITGGHYYFTNDAHQLPLIFGKETRFDVKPVKLNGRVTVSAGADSPVVRSLAGHPLPPLTGNVITSLKSGAQADLLAAGTGSQVDPAMAQWQDGAGRVVAFTPGVGPPWAGAWSRETALVNDTVRWVQRGISSSPLVPTVMAGAPPSLTLDLGQSPAGAALGDATITGTLTSSAGAGYPLDFALTGPALYRAQLPSLAPGVYRFSLAAHGARTATASGLLPIPYSAEYQPRLVADTPLGPLAALTGGRALAADDPGALTAGGWRSIWWALALAALALFVVGALGRMLERPPREPDGGGYSRTRPADRAASASTSSEETSVGART